MLVVAVVVLIIMLLFAVLVEMVAEGLVVIGLLQGFQFQQQHTQ